MFLETLFFPIGIVMLALGGDRLVLGAKDISSKLKVPPFVIGVFVLGFGTSLPELFVTISALENGKPDIAIGGILGSNIANVLLVMGFSLFLTKDKLVESISTKDISVMIGATILLCYFIYSSSIIKPWAFLMVLSLPLYLYLSYKIFNKNDNNLIYLSESSNFITIINLLIGFGFLIIGSELFIDGLIKISSNYGIPESIIGISLAAIGTSLPELSVTVAAFVRKEGSVALGNIVGSNIFNIFGVLGISTLISGTIDFSDSFRSIDLIVLLGTSFWVLYIAKNKPNNPRLFGLFSLLTYFLYMAYIYV